ncbi:plectin isoform x6 [Limosa lapponica baueri]|uniref:Plectin isoform x6 n=1 Tax=Limosa lapponica baueri TaxID=1758121 RepID=A0A2I0T0J7_LIMLA|nr:plectin isoform x6 [Limosa lapponica baueri]
MFPLHPCLPMSPVSSMSPLPGVPLHAPHVSRADTPPAHRVYRLHERLVAIRTEYNLRLKSGVPAATVTPVTTAGLGQQRPRPELEEAPLRYLQDLLGWVEENQRRLAAAEWGMDLPTVESHLGGHRGLHRSIEEFRAKIERARADEAQLAPGPRGAYRECLGKLDLQYGKLLGKMCGAEGVEEMCGAECVGREVPPLSPVPRTPPRRGCGTWRACRAT